LESSIGFYGDKAFRDQTSLNSDNVSLGSTSYVVQRDNDQYKITISRNNSINSLEYGDDEHSTRYELEDNLEKYPCKHERQMSLLISHRDLSIGNEDGVKLDDGDPPQCTIDVYPKAQAQT
jgi:hypothetical protein